MKIQSRTSNSIKAQSKRSQGMRPPLRGRPRMVQQQAAADVFAPKAVPSAKTLSQVAQSIEAVKTLLALRPPLDHASFQLALADGATREQVVPIAQEIAARHASIVADYFDAATVEECTQVIAALEPVLERMSMLERQVRGELARHKAIVGVQCRGLYNYLRAIAPTPRGQPIREPLDRWVAAMRLKRSPKAQAPDPVVQPVTGSSSAPT